MSAHTPGPWVMHDNETVRAPDQLNRIVADTGFGPSHETARANARLIAAAPDLLNCLTVLADAAEARGIPADAARAAIAKASGARRRRRAEAQPPAGRPLTVSEQPGAESETSSSVGLGQQRSNK